MSVPDINDMPLTQSEVIARCRSLAASALIFLVILRLFYNNGGYSNVMQFHPICMMTAFVMVLPDVVTAFKRLQIGKKPSEPTKKDFTRRSRIIVGLPRGEVVLRHQFTAFVMEVAAAGGFSAIEYVKITNGYPHLKSPHSMVGAACGVAILCQMVLGTLLRYVLARGQPIYKKVVIVHKLASLTIMVTGMMALAGGLLGTSYAEQMMPSSAVRTMVALASVCIFVVGLIV